MSFVDTSEVQLVAPKPIKPRAPGSHAQGFQAFQGHSQVQSSPGHGHGHSHHRSNSRTIPILSRQFDDMEELFHVMKNTSFGEQRPQTPCDMTFYDFNVPASPVARSCRNPIIVNQAFEAQC